MAKLQSLLSMAIWYICGQFNLGDRVLKVADIDVTSVKAVEVDNKIQEELIDTNGID